MTQGSLVSKVVCADILLFKCQSVNYANGHRASVQHIHRPPSCVHSTIYRVSY